MSEMTVVHREHDAFPVLVRGHVIRVHQPYSAAGTDDGPTPVEPFVAVVDTPRARPPSSRTSPDETGWPGRRTGVSRVSVVTGADLTREPFLSGLRNADLARLATAARFTGFPAGRRIFNESDPAERFWLVRDGTVAVDLRTPGRGPVVIENFGPGSVLGWSWLFRPHRWRFGAFAQTPVRAIEFDGRLVRTLSAVDPSLGYELTRRFAELVVERLEATQTRLLEVSLDDAPVP